MGRLHKAAAEGDVARVREYIQAGDDVNDMTESLTKKGVAWTPGSGYGAGHITPLQIAAYNGHTEVVEVLVQEGKARLELRTDGRNKTAFEIAVSEKFFATARKFIQLGAEDKQDLLQKALAKRKVRDELVTAAIYKRSGIVRELHESGLLTLGNMAEAMRDAAKYNAMMVAKELLEVNGGKIPTDGHHETPLGIAAEHHNSEMVELLLQAGASVDEYTHVTEWTNNRTPLRNALIRIGSDLKSKNSRVVHLLLEAGADVQEINRRGLSMLSEHGVPEEVELLLKKGLDPNTISEGESLLERAIFYSFKESSAKIAILLIDYGANVNALDANQRTYLHRTSNLALIAKLVEKGLDVNGKDGAGKTPIQHFSHRRDEDSVKAAECLIAHGANIRDLNPMSDLVAASAVLKQKFKEIGVSTERIIPELQMAILRKENIEQIKALLTLENVNAIDYQGHTALHFAADTGQDTVISLLLKYKATVSVTDELGNTPLHYAAEKGHLNSVKILLGTGAESHLKNVSGKTPLALANDWAINATLLDGVVDGVGRYGIRFHASEGPNFGGIQRILEQHMSKSKMQHTPSLASVSTQESKQKVESNYWDAMRANEQKLRQEMSDRSFTFADFHIRMCQDVDEAIRIHGNPYSSLLSHVHQTQPEMPETPSPVVCLSGSASTSNSGKVLIPENALSEGSDNDGSVEDVIQSLDAILEDLQGENSKKGPKA